MNFDITPRAEREIERIANYWAENRDVGAEFFLRELEEAEKHLRTLPESGEAWRMRKNEVIRRWLLEGSSTHLYYVYQARRERILVVAVWGARRRAPKVGTPLSSKRK